MKRLAVTLAIALACASVCACYESPGVALHEPGVYKGSPDPLLAKQQSADQQKRLQQRFAQIQTDR